MTAGDSIQLIFGDMKSGFKTTIIFTQKLKFCNCQHVCLLMSAVYFIVNISNLYSPVFGGAGILVRKGDNIRQRIHVS